MPLQHSKLITRKQLHSLSGGKKDKDVRYCNPLRLGTPFNYVGGRAVAMARGQVHHICIKEDYNVELPESNQELFEMHRFAKKVGDELQPDVKLLMERGSQHPPIPIFWEPSDQSSRKPTAGERGMGVSYVGHWNVLSVIPERTMIHGIQRCAVLKFRFDRYDTSFSKIIELFHDKSCEQIETISFENIVPTNSTPGEENEEDGGGYTAFKSPERPRHVVRQPVAQVTPIASDNKPVASLRRCIRNKTRIDYQEDSDSSDGESSGAVVKPKLGPRKTSPRRSMPAGESHEEDAESEDDRKPKARKRHSSPSGAMGRAKRKPSERALPPAASAVAIAGDKGEESDDSSVVVMDVVSPPTYRYFQVIIDGEDENPRFVRLHATPNDDAYTFQDLRQAIQNQLSSLQSERRPLGSFQFTLGKLLVDPLQETWQVNEFLMVDSVADGSIGKPYQVTIKVKPPAAPAN